MAKIVVLGAGVSGHTAVSYLQKELGKEHEIVMVSPNRNYQWIPSNIWIGVGRMTPKQTVFPLKPIYKKKGIKHILAKAISFHPEGDENQDMSYVLAEYVAEDKKGQKVKVTYDYLINATGPKLNFQATEGLMPGTNKVVSVCTYNHAQHAWKELYTLIQRMKKGEHVKILVGTGHAKATCQGAAFEYILNIEHELNRHKVRDKATITWISNEYELGDFGIDGGFMKAWGKIISNKDIAEMLFEDRNINYITGAGIYKIEDGVAYYENLEGEYKQENFDFAMLIPSFSGHGFKAFDKYDKDITDKLFKGFMIVDADYTPKPYEEWTVQDWPETYQNPSYTNIFAPGIAFAPPHTISKPRKSKNGTPIFPSPPRTGMPSGVSAKVVVDNVVELVKNGKNAILHKGSMGNMGAACVASTGFGITNGSAITMTVNPIVPDYKKYPDTYGRNLNDTIGDYGLAGHWLKLTLHYMFIYKAKMKPFWWLIPE
jgi:sulfide:quinone oxidoreductase